MVEPDGRARPHPLGQYGADPTTWGEDIRMFRIEPTWLVGYGDVAE